MEERLQPINLLSHSNKLKEDEALDEEAEELQRELVYNVSAEASNLRVTRTEINGFVAWVFSAIATVAFTLWAFVPDEFFHRFGIYYLPNKYYVPAIANWWIVTVYYLSFITYLWFYSVSHNRSSLFTLVDRHTTLRKAHKESAKEIAEI